MISASVSARRPTLTFAALVGLALLVGCGEVVTDLPPIDDYQSWDSITTSGVAPGHGDTIRIIYANDQARSYPHSGRYLPDSILVKEIYQKKSDGTAGELSYIAVMRRILASPGDPLYDKLHDGWLFTSLGELGDDEVYSASCWNRCHVQAPIAGAWFDYGR